MSGRLGRHTKATESPTPTADKAQSKLWFQDGSWWGLLWSASANATKIHKLDVATQAWQETGTVVDARANARGDALWDAKDGKLYVVSGSTVLSEWSSPPSQEAVTSGSAELHRFSYNASTKTYSRDAGFPVTVHSGSTESITVAKDSVGKLWVTYTVVSADNSNRVYINHSTTSDTAWGTPFVLPTTNAQVHHDDISAVTSFQGDKIAIMWSNQRPEHKRFYLAIHQDGQPENSWQTETAYGGGNNCTGGCANDHLNLRQLTSDGSGRLYAAIKTAAQLAGQTFVALLVRDGKGQWTSAPFGVVEDAHTRPMVMIDEEHRQVWMFAVAPEEGGTVYYKKSPIDNVSFPPGAGTPIIRSSTDNGHQRPHINETKCDRPDRPGGVGGREDQRPVLARLYRSQNRAESHCGQSGVAEWCPGCSHHRRNVRPQGQWRVPVFSTRVHPLLAGNRGPRLPGGDPWQVGADRV